MSQIPSDMLSVLIASTQEVFETMVFEPVGSEPPIEGESERPKAHVIGTVSFTGERCGVVAFYSTNDTARTITGAMLGIPHAAVHGAVPDASGQITNMIAGTFRTRMAASGLPLNGVSAGSARVTVSWREPPIATPT